LGSRPRLEHGKVWAENATWELTHSQMDFHFGSWNVTTPLWGKCEDETRTSKSGNLESSETPEILELDYRGQNILP